MSTKEKALRRYRRAYPSTMHEGTDSSPSFISRQDGTSELSDIHISHLEVSFALYPVPDELSIFISPIQNHWLTFLIQSVLGLYRSFPLQSNLPKHTHFPIAAGRIPLRHSLYGRYRMPLSVHEPPPATTKPSHRQQPGVLFRGREILHKISFWRK